MGLFKRKNVWYFENKITKRVSLKTKDKATAIKIAKELEDRYTKYKLGIINLEQATVRKLSSPYTIQDVYTKWIKTEISSKTNTNYYTSKFKPFLKQYGNHAIEMFTYEQACDYKNNYLFTIYTNKTVHNHLSVIKMMLEWAKNARYIQSNPMDVRGFLPSTKATKPRKAIPVEHVMQAIKYANRQDEIYWTILLHTGLRRKDAGTLQPDDIVRGMFQEKSGQYRQIPMTNKLKSYGNDIYNIMPTNTERVNSLKRFQAFIKDRYGYETDFHSIRHTTFTLLVNAGEFDENQVGRILGTKASVSTYAKTDFNRVTQVLNEVVGNA